jgi:LmbE family N-acetylglucosaminyl deacetylase
MQPMPEDWETAVAVVAHPDDLEYGVASAVARWTGQGKKVTYLLATLGEAGIAGMAPAETAPLREEEERRSAAIVSVSEVEFLAHRDGLVEYGIPLRRDLAAAFRAIAPEVVITMSFDLTWGEEGPVNHADHRAVGLAVLDASGTPRTSGCSARTDRRAAPSATRMLQLAATRLISWTSPARSMRASRPCASIAPTWTASAVTSTLTNSCGT